MKNKEIEELEKRAETGDALALFELGEKYHLGDGIKKDETKAFDYYKKSAEAGNARAQYTVGMCFEGGKYVEKDLKTANKWFEKAAKQNNAEALNKLAYHYYQGYGCEQSGEKAFEFYSKAANLGDAVSQFILAKLYYSEGCDKDENTAVKWYTESANHGNSDALRELADIYCHGWNSIEENPEKAFELKKKYVEQCVWDNTEKRKLADMYYSGYGCEQNYEKAFELFKDAAESPMADKYAQYCLGWMYEHGQGTEMDVSEAEFWYKRAASRDEENALYALARIYHKRAKDIPFSSSEYQMAKDYYERAIANGYEDKDKNFDKLKKEMETYFVIEGTVSEYSLNKTFDFVTSQYNECTDCKEKICVSFCITGSEGFSVKREYRNPNVFWIQSYNYNYGEIKESYIVEKSLKFTVSKEFSSILIQAVNQNKRIRFVISKTELEFLSENKNNSEELKDITISLLQD